MKKGQTKVLARVALCDLLDKCGMLSMVARLSAHRASIEHLRKSHDLDPPEEDPADFRVLLLGK